MKAARLLEYGGQLLLEDVQTPTIARSFGVLKEGGHLVATAQPVSQEANVSPAGSRRSHGMIVLRVAPEHS
jgi:hypothetical protein